MGEKYMGCGFKPGKMSKNGSKIRDAGANDGDRVPSRDRIGTGDGELRTGKRHGQS